MRGFGAKTDNKVVLDLDLAVKPNTGSHLIYPGRYRLGIVVTADNSKPVKKIFELNLNDFWDDNEAVMLEKGLTAREAR